MKILWLSHLVPYPPKAGVLIRAHYLVKELAKYHDVDLLAFNQKALIEPYFNSYEEGTETAKAQLSRFCGHVEVIDCPTDKSPLAPHWCALKSLVSPHPYTINWLASREYAEAVKRLHKANQYDLIHCDTISLAPYVEEIDNSLLSLDHHNVESHMLHRRAELETNWLKKLYFKLEGKRVENTEKHYCPQFDINITCSDLDNDRFREFIPTAKFVCIPNGVDIEVFKPSPNPPKANQLIFIGTLDWYPNTRAVLFIAEQIWPKLKEVLPDASIDIIGARPPRELLSLAESDPSFRVHGYVDDLNQYLSDATAYICPIDDGGGTKLKILDALSAGKAIIANPIACEGISCQNGKQILFAETPEEYVQQIENVFSQPTLRTALETAARELAVSTYSYDSIGKQLSDEYITLQHTSLRQANSKKAPA